MQRSILIGLSGLLVGLIIGFFVANRINRGAALSTSPGQIQANTSFPNQQQNPSGGMQPEVAQALERAKNEPKSFEAQMGAGEMYAQIGSFEKAKDYFQKAAALAPNTFEGDISVANAFFDIRQFEDAEKFYAKALELKPDDIDARTDLASTYIERPNPDFDRGIAEFNESLKFDPRHEPTLYNLAIAYFRKGDVENAKKTAARLEEINPSSQLNQRLKENLSKK